MQRRGPGGTMVVTDLTVCEREGAALMYPNVVTPQRYRRRPRAASLRENKRVITTSVVAQNGQLTHVLSSPYGPKHRCLQHQMDSAQTWLVLATAPHGERTTITLLVASISKSAKGPRPVERRCTSRGYRHRMDTTVPELRCRVMVGRRDGRSMRQNTD